MFNHDSRNVFGDSDLGTPTWEGVTREASSGAILPRILPRRKARKRGERGNYEGYEGGGSQSSATEEKVLEYKTKKVTMRVGNTQAILTHLSVFKRKEGGLGMPTDWRGGEVRLPRSLEKVR